MSFYSLTKYFHEFQSIFVNFCFTDIFVKISTDISDISVKSKYRYICDYQYFDPCIILVGSATEICNKNEVLCE